VSYTLVFKNQAVDPVGKSPVTVPVGTVNTTSTSLALTGKGASNFGKFQQENLLRLLECFADTTAPSNPTVGQLWYDSASLTLKVLIDASPQTWKSLGGIQVTGAGTPPAAAALGDIWFERTGSAAGFLYVYTGIGRYPTTTTTIGGWDQIWPSVEVYGGREEYDLVRQLVEQIAGSGVNAFGSGAIGRVITNLTNFGALDLDLRTKYKALTPLDSNILFSPNAGVNIDREITRQAPSTTLFYFNDSSSPSDGYIGGMSTNPAVSNVAGSIYIGGVLTTVPPMIMTHGVTAVEDGYIVWDQTGTLVSTNAASNMFVARQTDAGGWEYDNNSAWVTFTPVANMYAIGTISTFQADNNTINPIDKTAFMWMHAVPLIGTKYEHLKVEPNSQDWDVLLAAAKYAISRLEVPYSFVRAVSSLPFVADGRQAPSSQLSLNSQTDPRFPAAARRSNRHGATIRQVQNFSETVNALNVAIANRFSIQGINGFTGTFPYFRSNTATTTFASGLSGNVPAGNGSFRMQFRFASMDEMNRFLGSGGALEFALTHTGGAQTGDTNFRSLLSSAGTWRLSGDKTRIFGQSLPLTITQSTVNAGLWNGNGGGTLMNTVTISSNTLSFYVWRVSNTQLDVQILFASQAMSGTTSLTVNLISDNETYFPGPALVYPQPLTFNTSDVVDPF
jgi:hypothetical protein